MHYKLNTRNDTPYWQAARNDIKISDSVLAIKTAWYTGADFENALNEQAQDQVYLRPSWYCIFAGMGYFKEAHNAAPPLNHITDLQARNYCEKTALEFHDHSQTIDSMSS